MTKFRYKGAFAQEIRVGDNSLMVEPGAFLDMSDEDLNNPDNKALVEDGLLMNAESGETLEHEQEATHSGTGEPLEPGTETEQPEPEGGDDTPAEEEDKPTEE